MPAPPAQLLEFGGAENPGVEERLTKGLKGRQDEWTTAAERGPERRLRAAQVRLRRAGVNAANIETYLSSPLDQREPVEELLMLARERRCQTIVIGHRSHTSFGGDRDPLAERLIRDGTGFAVWVID
jgi:nucleotide-binding universal stress UspA family protein